MSFAEVSSFMVFTLEVAPRLPVHILLPLLSAVYCVSLCHELWEDFRVSSTLDKMYSKISLEISHLWLFELYISQTMFLCKVCIHAVSEKW